MESGIYLLPKVKHALLGPIDWASRFVIKIMKIDDVKKVFHSVYPFVTAF